VPQNAIDDRRLLDERDEPQPAAAGSPDELHRLRRLMRSASA
jgi:hypothetical protein